MWWRTTVCTCQTLDTACWGEKKHSFDCSLNVHRSSTFSSIPERQGPPWTIGLTLSTSADLSDLSSTPGSMRSAFLRPRQDNYKAQELLPEDSRRTKPLSQRHNTIRQTPAKSHWLLYPHRQRIDFRFLLSPGWHVLRICGSDPFFLCL